MRASPACPRPPGSSLRPRDACCSGWSARRATSPSRPPLPLRSRWPPSVAPLAAGSIEDRYAALASATAALVGVLFLIGGRLRLGFLSDFIARSVLKGFMFGLALTIISRQLPKLLGTRATSGDFLTRLVAAFTDGHGPHLPTVLLSSAALLFLFFVAPRLGKVPPALSCLVAGLAVGGWLPAERFGIHTVGAEIARVPLPGLPAVGWTELMALLPAAFGVSLLLLIESMGSARTFASRGGYKVDANRDMTGLALANLGSAGARGIVVGGGVSATAANYAAGARTQLAGLRGGRKVPSVLSLVAVPPLLQAPPRRHPRRHRRPRGLAPARRQDAARDEPRSAPVDHRRAGGAGGRARVRDPAGPAGRRHLLAGAAHAADLVPAVLGAGPASRHPHLREHGRPPERRTGAWPARRPPRRHGLLREREPHAPGRAR